MEGVQTILAVAGLRGLSGYVCFVFSNSEMREERKKWGGESITLVQKFTICSLNRDPIFS